MSLKDFLASDTSKDCPPEGTFSTDAHGKLVIDKDTYVKWAVKRWAHLRYSPPTSEQSARSATQRPAVQDRGWLPRRGPGVPLQGVPFGIKSRFHREEPSAKPATQGGRKKESSISPASSVRDPRLDRLGRLDPRLDRFGRRFGPADVNPHGPPIEPGGPVNGYTGRGWHGPNESLAPRGEPTMYRVGDVNAPRGADKFGDPHSLHGGSRIGPSRFLGQGPRPTATQYNSKPFTGYQSS